MAKKFSDLRSCMKPESQLLAQARTKQFFADMAVSDLKQARGLSQKMLAEVLNVQPQSIAKLEKRADMYLSTLRTHIQAMGGDLEIIARFPNASVKIINFSDIENATGSGSFE